MIKLLVYDNCRFEQMGSLEERKLTQLVVVVEVFGLSGVDQLMHV